MIECFSKDEVVVIEINLEYLFLFGKKLSVINEEENCVSIDDRLVVKVK